MPCGWGGNRRSGVALAMRHMRSADISTCVVPRTLSSYKDRIFLQPRGLACGTLLNSSPAV